MPARRAHLRADLPRHEGAREPDHGRQRDHAFAGSAAGLVALLFLQMAYVAMVYGPIAAYLVELFPTSIRYTSMSLPYHLGNGWFGGFLPLIATAVTTSAWARESFGEGAIFAGLIYPIAVCLMTWRSAASSSARRRTTASTRRSGTRPDRR
jgi:hypothetical protein